MAGTAQKSKAVAAPRKVNRSTKRAREQNRTKYAELVRLARLHKVDKAPSVSAPEVLQELIDRALGNWRWASSELDNVPGDQFWVSKVDAQGNLLVEPHPFYQLEHAAAAELERLAETMVGLGLAERMVRIEEARAAAVVSAVREAAREAGLNAGQVRALGANLRRRLEAGAEEEQAA